jgi:hypothetical protein
MWLIGTLKYKKTEKEVTNRGPDIESNCNYGFFFTSLSFPPVISIIVRGKNRLGDTSLNRYIFIIEE